MISVKAARDFRRAFFLEYDSIDWTALYKRLSVFATALAKSAPDVFDGVSCIDLVNETLLDFMRSETALGWESQKGPLPAYLCGVLRNKFLQRIKRHGRVAVSTDEKPYTEISAPESEGGLLKRIEVKQWIASLKERLSPHSDLQDLITASESIDGDYNINQQLADSLKTTPNDVVNRKKRIRRILFGGQQ